nr:MAG TPA: hypothetical protein [Caudoviricetes sp.]
MLENRKAVVHASPFEARGDASYLIRPAIRLQTG